MPESKTSLDVSGETVNTRVTQRAMITQILALGTIWNVRDVCVLASAANLFNNGLDVHDWSA